MRRLNRYVEEQAPWKLAKDDARAAELDRVLRSLAEGLRVVGVLLRAVDPGRLGEAAGGARRARRRLAAARYGAGAVAPVAKIAPLFPEARPVA